MTRKPKWTSESVGEYERSLKPIEQPKVRTGNCLRVGVCASEGHKIQPQRTWVGLTDEEIEMVYAVTIKIRKKDIMPVEQKMFAKTIEQFLKERNT